jgi:uncharacterized membrane protein
MTCGKDILAVQSLRNHIMGASLLATTSILLASTMSGFAANPGKWSGQDAIFALSTPIEDDLADSTKFLVRNLLAIKFFALIISFIICFFCYLQSIRLNNHVCYLINIPTNSTDSPLVSYVCRALAKASNFYTIGTRFLYFSLLILMWLFNAICMLIATIILICVLFILDRTEGMEREYRQHESHSVQTESGQDAAQTLNFDKMAEKSFHPATLLWGGSKESLTKAGSHLKDQYTHKTERNSKAATVFDAV